MLVRLGMDLQVAGSSGFYLRMLVLSRAGQYYWGLSIVWVQNCACDISAVDSASIRLHTYQQDECNVKWIIVYLLMTFMKISPVLYIDLQGYSLR